MTMEKKSILERLNQGEIIIGDGGYLFVLEKRGYVKAGAYTPEASVEHPEAVRQCHREFLRAGSDVLLAFTFYASEDKLENRGHDAGQKFGCTAINKASCQLAREVANEGDALVAGGLSQTPSYVNNLGHDECVKIFKQQVDVFVENGVDFLIGETFEHVEEAEWAVEAMKTSGKPVAICMSINNTGDLHGVSTGDCAVRLAKAGADIIGVNCLFDPDITLQAIQKMKEGLDAAGLKRHLITQPLGFHTPDVTRQGFSSTPEFPFALEPRVLTRWECHKYARAAYDLGVRFISGCCGFEAYHIRALAEELAEERGRYPKASDKHGLWGEGLRQHTRPWVRARVGREYWENLKPATGRPYCPSMSKSFSLDVPAGHEALKQTKHITDE